MSFRDDLSKRAADIGAALAAELAVLGQDQIAEGMRYATGGGKRLRGFLALAHQPEEHFGDPLIPVGEAKRLRPRIARADLVERRAGHPPVVDMWRPTCPSTFCRE